MVDKFGETGIIKTKEVEDAFRAVPRGAFLPPDLKIKAYEDSPIQADPHIHMSAPHMYAIVLEALQLSSGKLNEKACLAICHTSHSKQKQETELNLWWEYKSTWTKYIVHLYAPKY